MAPSAHLGQNLGADLNPPFSFPSPRSLGLRFPPCQSLHLHYRHQSAAISQMTCCRSPSRPPPIPFHPEVRSQHVLCLPCVVTQSCPTLCDPKGGSPPGSGSSVHGDSPGKNTGVGCHALLQGIFPTQGSNPGLPHCRWILYRLSHQGSLKSAWSFLNLTHHPTASLVAVPGSGSIPEPLEVRKIPWRRKWQPTPVFLPGESHGQRSLAGYSPWGRKRAGHSLVTKQQGFSYSLTFGAFCPLQYKGPNP